jgi:hypothetical protein
VSGSCAIGEDNDDNDDGGNGDSLKTIIQLPGEYQRVSDRLSV